MKVLCIYCIHGAPVTVAAEYPQSTIKGTPICSNHSGTALYKTITGGQSNLGVYLIYFDSIIDNSYRGPACFHRLTPNKRFEPVFSTVIMAVCSLFNRMLLFTD